MIMVLMLNVKFYGVNIGKVSMVKRDLCFSPPSPFAYANARMMFYMVVRRGALIKVRSLRSLDV